MARGYANAKFKWNGKRSVVIQNLGFGNELQRDTANIFLKYSEEYTPYLSGKLLGSAYVRVANNRGYITYPVPYANIQYDDVGRIKNRTTTFHPLATSKWVDVAYQHHKSEITKEVDLARLKYRSFKY